MSDITLFKKGLKDGIPICLGYLAVSFAFGISAGQINLSIFQAVLMSLTNVTSAGQFAALGIISAGASLVEIALTQFVLNLRYLLMSCALSQKLDSSTTTHARLLVAFGVTDEIFGVSMASSSPLVPKYSYGLMCVSIAGWCFGTFLGIALGNILPESISLSLSVAIYGMFIAIVVPVAKADKKVLICSVFAIIISCLFKYVPALINVSSGFQIIISTVIAASVCAVLFPKEVTDE